MYTHGPVNYEYVLLVASIYGLHYTAKEWMDSWDGMRFALVRGTWLPGGIGKKDEEKKQHWSKPKRGKRISCGLRSVHDESGCAVVCSGAHSNAHVAMTMWYFARRRDGRCTNNHIYSIKINVVHQINKWQLLTWVWCTHTKNGTSLPNTRERRCSLVLWWMCSVVVAIDCSTVGWTVWIGRLMIFLYENRNEVLMWLPDLPAQGR